MSQDFTPGDYLVFQVECGFGLLRLLAIDHTDRTVWHLAGYEDIFLDVETAEQSLENPDALQISHAHLALTTRAFESTQIARILNREVTDVELDLLNAWRNDPESRASDRSVRLLLGMR
jgi:hypothetical protein